MERFDAFADFRVDGHAAFVTGGAQSIGEVLSRTCSGAGAKVASLDLNTKTAQQTAANITNHHRQRNALTGRPGTPHDIANAFLWLASPAGSRVSGKTPQILGGGKRMRLKPE